MFDALFIGRFQPLHNGHLHALADIFSRETSVIIAVGSSDKSRSFENPLNFEERREMIFLALIEMGIERDRYVVVAVPDIEDSSLWVSHVRNLVGDFKRIYTGSSIVKSLFEDAGMTVSPVSFLDGVTATIVRNAVLKGGDYASFVSPSVFGYLEKIDFVGKLQNIL